MNEPRKESPLYVAAINGKLTLRAVADSADEAAAAAAALFPETQTAPHDWNPGHPFGALLQRDIEFDVPGSEDDPRPVISWFQLLRGGKSIGSFQLGAPLELSPGVTNRISRALVIPRFAPEPEPA